MSLGGRCRVAGGEGCCCGEFWCLVGVDVDVEVERTEVGGEQLDALAYNR